MDGNVLELGIRLIQWIYNRHYRVSRLVYVVIGVAGLVALFFSGDSTTTLVAGLVAVGLSIQGLIRWWILSHPRPVLAVARFDSTDSERAREIQRTIMTSLADHLGTDFPLSIIAVPETVGGNESRFAAALRRRLRAVYLVFGDVRVIQDKIAVYPRLLEPSRSLVKHVDEFTNETIPQRTIWQEALFRLSGGAVDLQIEYPFEFATELLVLLRSIEGKALSLVERHDQAVAVLQESLQRVATSTSHAIDEIRVDLAQALDKDGRRDDAIDLLRQRALRGGASPDLLRALALFLAASPFGILPGPYSPASAGRVDEAIRWLQEAAAIDTDPFRDLTQYNLMQLLVHASRQGEADSLMDELLRSRRSHYRRAWYVLRSNGARHWAQATTLAATGQQGAAQQEFAAAASFYVRAIWRRPKVILIRGSRFRPPRLQRIPVPPVLYGNAADAYRASGRDRLAAVLEWRERRKRRRYLKRGDKALRQERFEQADAYFKWAATGRGDTFQVHALVGRHIASRGMSRNDGRIGDQAGVAEHDADAARNWSEAVELEATYANDIRDWMEQWMWWNDEDDD